MSNIKAFSLINGVGVIGVVIEENDKGFLLEKVRGFQLARSNNPNEPHVPSLLPACSLLNMAEEDSHLDKPMTLHNSAICFSDVFIAPGLLENYKQSTTSIILSPNGNAQGFSPVKG